jgi:rhodanese-related sulfurtransferase
MDFLAMEESKKAVKEGKMQHKSQMIKALNQLTVIILLSLISALLVNQFRPDRLPLVADWSPETRLTFDSGKIMVIPLVEAKRLFSSGRAIFLDARSPEEYREGHIRGAINLPWQSFAQYVGKVMLDIPPDARIVTYCDGEHCSLSEDLAMELFFMGYENIRVLVNGWNVWQENSLPIEKDLK